MDTTTQEIMQEINPEFTPEVNKAIKELTEYLSKCYDAVNKGNVFLWRAFGQALIAVGFDKDLRIISQTFKPMSMNDYIVDKSIQRKSLNALATIDPLFTILRNVIPPEGTLISSLSSYMKSDARDFISDIGTDFEVFLIWLDYRTKGNDYVRRMKKATYENIRKIIDRDGDVVFIHILIRALMAYKAVVSRTQTICNNLNIESGIDERERLKKEKEKKNKVKLSDNKKEIKPTSAPKNNKFNSGKTAKLNTSKVVFDSSTETNKFSNSISFDSLKKTKERKSV